MLGKGLELLEVIDLFVDDTAQVAASEEKLYTLVSVFGRVCERRKLRVNVS